MVVSDAAKALTETRLSDLPAELKKTDSVALIEEAKKADTRTSAPELYDARIAELRGASGGAESSTDGKAAKPADDGEKRFDVKLLGWWGNAAGRQKPNTRVKVTAAEARTLFASQLIESLPEGVSLTE